MDLAIRKAKTEDSESLTELSNQLNYKTNNSDMQNRLSEILKHDDHCVYVAVVNRKTVGWIHGFFSLRVESDFFVEIGGLIVNVDYRKKGIGNKLVDKVISWTESRNCRLIRVRCNSIRKESHQFYETIGFNLNKEQKVFSKTLNS